MSWIVRCAFLVTTVVRALKTDAITSNRASEGVQELTAKTLRLVGWSDSATCGRAAAWVLSQLLF